MPFFTLQHQDTQSNARAGILHTDHGDVPTPIFMPVGTKATVKSLSSTQVANLNAPIILANTYHLYLQPGADLINNFGGIHKFMHWNRPLLTDSGGFQVFSLGAQKNEKEKNSHEKLVTIDEDGVTFKSVIDGSTHRFTPERAIEIQQAIGADIIMAFDECTSDTAPKEYAMTAMERTHRWLDRSLAAHKKNTAPHGYQQFFFGIIQGGMHHDLRKTSTEFITSRDVDGVAIGGESIGFNMAATAEILDHIMPHIPEKKPRYTMGLGYSPLDLFTAVSHGVDMFDCVAPTRIARNGTLYVHGSVSKNYKISITNAAYKQDHAPIDPLCNCETCTNYSRAYIHHLFKAQELLAFQLATIHNIHFFLSLMQEMRAAIVNNAFIAFQNEWLRR